MLDKPESLHTLGLEIEGDYLKGAEFLFVKGMPQLKKLFKISIKDVNLLYTESESNEIKQTLETALITTSLKNSETLVRSLEIKLRKQKDVDAVLHFQAEPLLPYSIDKAIIDKIKISQSNESTLLTIIAARKDHIEQHLTHWKNIQIDPEIVTSTSASLVAFARFFSPTEATFFIVHLGEKETSCVLVIDQKLVGAQTCLIGFKESKPEELKLNISRTLYSLAKQAKGKEISHLLICGEGGVDFEKKHFLFNDLGKFHVKLLDTDQYTSSQLQQYAIPLGAALGALPKAIDPINFRQKELNYSNPWKRFKQPLAIYLGLFLFLSFSFYLFGQAYLASQKDLLRQNYIALLSTMNKTYKISESEYLSKHFDEETKDLMDLTEEDISSRLNHLQKEIQATPDLFPLLPNVPKVSDVLAWITNHPKVIQKESNTPLLQLENFSYSMIKRPEQNKKNEKYQVRVEIEFTTTTPKTAREFHDALIAPNEIVDAKGEVKWSSNRGKYRTSFFLKDKTVYPSVK